MSARYLVRFDDICPTMNWTLWREIESTLIRLNIKPILAVVPDNQDDALKVDAPVPDFWKRVREWQARGWTIAIHGYQHRYVTRDAGLMRINPYSEFAGLSELEQERKLTRAVAIFRQNGVKADAWVAPAHSFDRTTVKILKKLGVGTISDGFSALPYTDDQGVLWIPQQLWRFRNVRNGVWTVCLHHNDWTSRDSERFRIDIESYKDRLTNVEEMTRRYKHRHPNLSDAFWQIGLRSLFVLKHKILTGKQPLKALATEEQTAA